MRVIVTLAVDVDPAAWREEYGTDNETAAQLRARVRDHVATDVGNSAAADAGAITQVTLRTSARAEHR